MAATRWRVFFRLLPPLQAPRSPERLHAQAAAARIRRMGTLYLVRHGQASFGAADYDQLSDLGHKQSLRLGQYFAQKGIRFDGLIAGTLRRHKQTLEGILLGM